MPARPHRAEARRADAGSRSRCRPRPRSRCRWPSPRAARSTSRLGNEIRAAAARPDLVVGTGAGPRPEILRRSASTPDRSAEDLGNAAPPRETAPRPRRGGGPRIEPRPAARLSAGLRHAGLAARGALVAAGAPRGADAGRRGARSRLLLDHELREPGTRAATACRRRWRARLRAAARLTRSRRRHQWMTDQSRDSRWQSSVAHVSLVVGQGSPAASELGAHGLHRAERATLQAGRDCLGAPAVWGRLEGRVAALDAQRRHAHAPSPPERARSWRRCRGPSRTRVCSGGLVLDQSEHLRRSPCSQPPSSSVSARRPCFATSAAPASDARCADRVRCRRAGVGPMIPACLRRAALLLLPLLAVPAAAQVPVPRSARPNPRPAQSERPACSTPSATPAPGAATSSASSPTTGRVVDTGNGLISHSEGQGYGMLLAVAAGDRARSIASGAGRARTSWCATTHSWPGAGSPTSGPAWPT